MVDPESRIGISRQVASPPAARALSMLSDVDYEGRLVQTGPAQDRTGEEWVRAVLEDAPMRTRNALSMGWFALGLRLGSTRSDRSVLGWEVRVRHARTSPSLRQRPPRVVGRTAWAGVAGRVPTAKDLSGQGRIWCFALQRGAVPSRAKLLKREGPCVTGSKAVLSLNASWGFMLHG